MTLDSSHQAGTIRVMFGGDVMLGRIVKQHILRHGPDYPLGRVAQLMRDADLTIVNLECAITSCDEIWPGAPKAFYFGAPPQAIDALLGAGIDMVCVANNHTLDFGVKGLLDTVHLLHRHGIRYAGAGTDSAAASAPAIMEWRGMRFGMAALCDHQADCAAQQDRAGIAYLDLDDEPAAIAVLRDALRLTGPSCRCTGDRTWCLGRRKNFGGWRMPPSTWSGRYCSATVRTCFRE